MLNLAKYPALLLNADYQPLETYPLSIVDAWDAIKLVWEGNADVVAEYDQEVRSPSITMKLPSVLALKNYIKKPKVVVFNKFNVFLRDGFVCQYCGQQKAPHELTYDHVKPRADGGKTTWDNIASACGPCNTKKGHGYSMKPKRAPFEPTYGHMEKMKRLFPPSYLHETWMDYLYWDTPLESDNAKS